MILISIAIAYFVGMAAGVLVGLYLGHEFGYWQLNQVGPPGRE